MSEATRIGQHVLIVTTAGSFTVDGRRLTEPVDAADKLAKLILWAAQRGGLKPIPGSGDQSVPARVWVVGGAVGLLTGVPGDYVGDPGAHLGRALAPLVDDGWELRGGTGKALVLGHGSGSGRVVVEVMAEQHPWLATGDATIADDAGELGRRLGRWHGALGALPGSNGAISGAMLADHIMGARAGRRGAIVSEPGLLAAWVTPELRIQPAWLATAEQVEHEFQHCEELVCLTQQSPALASAGMLTFGYGSPIALEADAAAAAASATKRAFGLWLADLPAADDLNLSEMLPLPHPQMAADHRVQAWLTTEDLDGLTKAVRDGGAGLTVEQLGISEAIVWPHKARILEAWASRLRGAREAFADDAPLLALMDDAAANYLSALADPRMWTDEAMRHHFQPAWAAAIATHIRLRGRRAAMRISREFRVWPLYSCGTAMIYALGRDEATETVIDLSDTHSRLGRMRVTSRTAVTDEMILAVLMAETTSEVSATLSEALDASAYLDHAAIGRTVQVDSTEAGARTDAGEPLPDAAAITVVEASNTNSTPAETDDQQEQTPTEGAKSRRAGRAKPVTGGVPAAVLHTDGLWLPDNTRVALTEPVTHVGQVAELAYKHDIGYRLSANYSERGQIWITEEACEYFGIDVKALAEARATERGQLLHELTHNIAFVTDALADGWRLGGGGEDNTVQRLGVWTRVYREGSDRPGVMIALIAGMDAASSTYGSPAEDDDDRELDSGKGMPVLTGKPSPAQIARRLQLLADALGFPWKINGNVTAIDLLVQSRPKTFNVREWKAEVLAPSTTAPPYGNLDIERDYNWTRQPSAEECQCRYVHAYDRGGSYFAALSTLELPIGDPVHHLGGAKFDPRLPGYWLVDVPENHNWRMPYVLNPNDYQFNEPKWVSTPRVERALALGYDIDIIEAIVWPRHGRVLRLWCERFSNANTVLDTDDPDAQAARRQAKVVRSTGLGIMGSDLLKGRPGYDPARRILAAAKANANIAYRFDQIGQHSDRWPVAALSDTVLYVSDDPDPKSAWPGGSETFGRGFGKYKPEGSALLADHLEFLDGNKYKGKKLLTAPDEWRERLPSFTDERGH